MPRGITIEVIERMAHAHRLVELCGCVTTATVMSELGLNHTEAYYVLRLLWVHNGVAKVVIGRTAVWCVDRETAERTVDALASTVRRLVCARRMRYATPTRVADLITSDTQAFKLFARYIQLDMTKRFEYRPAALAFIDALLQRAFGDPMRDGEKTVYYVTC